MKTVRINFLNQDTKKAYFDPDDNIILNILKERYNVVVTANPDYLIYSCFGFEHINFDGIKIFYTSEDISPDFNFCDYAIGFDRMEFGDRYRRFPFFAQRNEFKDAQKKHIFTPEEIASKTGFCNFVYSNSDANKTRGEFFEKLSRYKKVDSGGRYMNNIGKPVDDKIEFQKKYKFTIAFENDSSRDYTTEKIIDAFAAKTIPIYWGNPDIAKEFNPKSFINCHDYESFDEVIEKIKEIDSDPELYEAMLAEPIFENGIVPFEYTEDYLREFLFNIFDQPIEKARRRADFTYKYYYVKRSRRIFNIYCKVVNNPVSQFAIKLYLKLKGKK